MKRGPMNVQKVIDRCIPIFLVPTAFYPIQASERSLPSAVSIRFVGVVFETEGFGWSDHERWTLWPAQGLLEDTIQLHIINRVAKGLHQIPP